MDAAVARCALSNTTARAVTFRRPGAEWKIASVMSVGVYVGRCTSGSIRAKGAAVRNLGVTRTDQWFTQWLCSREEAADKHPQWARQSITERRNS